MKKVCFISGSRSDYGLLMPLMKLIKKDKNFIFQLIVTGTHLSKRHNSTFKEIIKDKFNINYLININVKGQKKEDICKSMSIATKNISFKLKLLKPDLIILLGDRYEIFSACSAAFVHQIPICHLHGGELTRGSIDDGFRHSITKMSNLHLVSTEKYSKRVKQLGENPKNIYVVGGFGVDTIKKTKLLKRDELERKLGFRLGPKNILVTYHPETVFNSNPKKDFGEILKALKKHSDIKVIFTKSNADLNGFVINKMIDEFVQSNNSKYHCISSMGQQNYLSTLNYIDMVIGNSSSGLLEVPSFKKATINIGTRQKDRMKASSVIDVTPKFKDISKAIKKAYSEEFKKILKKTINPYGSGGASKKTYKILKKLKMKKLIKGKFFEIK